MNGQVKVFTYGTIRDPQILGKIVGKENLVGYKASLNGYGLNTQRLDQVPNNVSPHAPVPLSPRQLLRESWDDGFESYGAKKQEGREMEGVVYSLNQEGLALLEDFEMVDFGWYKKEEVEVKTPNGEVEKVLILTLGEDQETAQEVEGNDYPTFPGNVTEEKFMRVVEKARREFFERQAATQEGASFSSMEVART